MSFGVEVFILANNLFQDSPGARILGEHQKMKIQWKLHPQSACAKMGNYRLNIEVDLQSLLGLHVT